MASASSTSTSTVRFCSRTSSTYGATRDQPAGELLARPRVDRDPHLLPGLHPLRVHLVDRRRDVHRAGVDEVEHGGDRHPRRRRRDPLPDLGAAVGQDPANGARTTVSASSARATPTWARASPSAASAAWHAACVWSRVLSRESRFCWLAIPSAASACPRRQLPLGQLGGEAGLAGLRLGRLHLLVRKAHLRRLDGVVEPEQQRARRDGGALAERQLDDPTADLRGELGAPARLHRPGPRVGDDLLDRAGLDPGDLDRERGGAEDEEAQRPDRQHCDEGDQPTRVLAHGQF